MQGVWEGTKQCVLQAYGCLLTWNILWLYKLPKGFIEKKTILRSPTTWAPCYRASWLDMPEWNTVQVSAHREALFPNTETQVRESYTWLWANPSTSVLLDTEAQSSLPRSLRHSFSHSNFSSPAGSFWHTMCHAGAWQQPAPTCCWCSHPLQARTNSSGWWKVSEWVFKEKITDVLYKAKDYSLSLLPSTHPWLTLGICVSWFHVVMCLRQALWCSVETRWQCSQL